MPSRASSSSERSLSTVKRHTEDEVKYESTESTGLVPVSEMKTNDQALHDLHAMHYGAIRDAENGQYDDDSLHNKCDDMDDLERGVQRRSAGGEEEDEKVQVSPAGPWAQRPKDIPKGLKGGAALTLIEDGSEIAKFVVSTAFILFVCIVLGLLFCIRR